MTEHADTEPGFMVDAEKRRTAIAQLADFDFADLCEKVRTSVENGTKRAIDQHFSGDYDEPCIVCQKITITGAFCERCTTEATKVIAQTVRDMETRAPKLFRSARTGSFKMEVGRYGDQYLRYCP